MQTKRILFLFFLCSQFQTFACLSANQERIIPIGSSEGCLIALEINAYRQEDPKDHLKPVWYYSVHLKGYNSDYSDYLIDRLAHEVLVKDQEVESYLREQVQKAIKASASSPNFAVFKAKHHYVCGFQASCFELEWRSGKTAYYLKDKTNHTTYSIPYFKPHYKGSYAKRYRDFFDFYFDQKKDKIGAKLSISSIRKFHNKTHEITIVHLGSGQRFGESTQEKRLQEIALQEPVLHHGSGFDFFILKAR